MPKFNHLHVHTQFSLLDGAADIKALLSKAQQDNMKAMAITDHGNMFGVFKFVAEAAKFNIKPIIGCEFYMVADRHKRQFTKEDKDIRYHQLLLAKNAEGYKNLVKLCSYGYIDGLYGKYPRIDKDLLVKYHKGLIATSCCLAAELPRTILKQGEEKAEESLKWWLDLFGGDYYIELQRHDIPEQNQVNEVLLKLANKYNVKVIASNDSHYVDKEDANAHDILLCINTGEKQSTPSSKDFDDGVSQKGKRFAFYNNEFYFKTTEEMSKLFSDLPQALDNTEEISDKIEPLKLKQDILLPNFNIPPDFANQDEYLKHLTYNGAKERYKEITPEIEERLNFELFTIQTMGFAGYFLIVSDFIKAGRDIGVFVGPGRGSAAGSAVAYCIGITNIDPIKYNLLFERFLNPDRKSMPDIDTDFDDEGRQKVIDYVVDKYGKNQVAQIVTYGTMAAKMSIKDVARVLDLPLAESIALAKLVPERPGVELDRVLNAPIDGEGGLKSKESFSPEEIEDVKRLREVMYGNDLRSTVLKEALVLEGSVRGTGIHAAGIIIAPKDLTEIIPVCTSKDTDLLITQFEGKVIEDAGVIKMDFLGLKTLTIIRDALYLIEQNHNVKIDIDNIPLTDSKTFELYQKGETNGTFQFESAGMQKYLKELKPDKFEDLIAMNALYRPGPLEYIPNFIARKHGKEAVSFDLPEMEEFLRETYGITVYQEQVMLLSQKLANFTKGDADMLRKAMGKKDKATLDKMKNKFIEGIKKNNLDEKICEKVWVDWEAFAQYAFNKSHSTCYAFVAFQTAYLKAHYPAEYMASVLTHNLSNIDKVTFFMEECRRMNIPLLGPDINESEYKFSVNSKGEIRFALGAIKGVGEAAVQAIVEERKANGGFKNIYDLTKRINLRAANKKCFESLALAGALDTFNSGNRAQYFYEDLPGVTFLETAMKYGASSQDNLNAMQQSLFGEESAVSLPEPKMPDCEPWTRLIQVNKEKEVTGFYISGHPLDDLKFELKQFCQELSLFKDLTKLNRNKDFTVGGMVTAINHRTTKNGSPFGLFTIEDFSGFFQFALFSEDYLRFKHFMVEGAFLMIKVKIQNRKFGPEDALEAKVLNIQLLSEVRGKMTNDVILNVALDKISDDFVEKVSKIINENPGDCRIKFNISDHQEKFNVEMPSRKIKVKLTDEVIGVFESMPEITILIK